MWGGYCYDVLEYPETRPLYYAWTISLWVAVGIFGWTAYRLIAEGLGVLPIIGCLDPATYFKADGAKGITYFILWLSLKVGGTLKARIMRGGASPRCRSA